MGKNIFIVNGVKYGLGTRNEEPKAFGGDVFVVRLKDGGTIITDNLWHLGACSEPNNAEFLQAGVWKSRDIVLLKKQYGEFIYKGDIL